MTFFLRQPAGLQSKKHYSFDRRAWHVLGTQDDLLAVVFTSNDVITPLMMSRFASVCCGAIFENIQTESCTVRLDTNDSMSRDDALKLLENKILDVTSSWYLDELEFEITTDRGTIVVLPEGDGLDLAIYATNTPFMEQLILKLEQELGHLNTLI